MPPTKSPLFDVVVANFNNTRYLPELVESIRNQTHVNWHLVIVDDCSTDDFEKFYENHRNESRISFVRHKKNLGVSAAFQSGISFGNGELIGLVGADDSLTNDALFECVRAFNKNNDACLIYTQANHCDQTMKKIGLWKQTAPLDPANHICQELPKISNFITFRRTAFEQTPGLDPSLKKAMDHDLILKLSETGTIHFLEKPLYNYRVHDGGISQGTSGVRAAQFSLLAQLRFQRSTKHQKLTTLQLRIKAHRYHSRSVFIEFSCTNNSRTYHALTSILYIHSFATLRTSFACLFLIVTRPFLKLGNSQL